MAEAASVLIWAFFLLAPVAGAAGAEGERPAPAAEADRRPTARERWARMSPAEKEQVREVYRRLQALPPSERNLLLERLRRMDPQARRRVIEWARQRLRERPPASRPDTKAPEKTDRTGKVEKQKRRPDPPRLPLNLSPEEKKKLEALTPPERKKELDRLAAQAFRKWAEKLPRQVAERVGRFTRREQMEFFRAYRESELLARVFAGEGEERRLLDLPPEELRPRLRPEGPPPEGVSEESWRRWQRLKPFERRQVLRRLERLARDRQASGRDA